MAEDNRHDDGRMSLTNYLCQAYLPKLIVDEDLPQVDTYADRWPRIPQLDMDEVRLVRIVSEIPLPALQNAVRTYFAGFENRLRTDPGNTRLTLPCPGIKVLTRSAMSHIVVGCEMDFAQALERLPLGTAAEALRTIERRPFDEDELKWKRIIVTAARNKSHRLWTVHTFGPQDPPTSIVRPGIAIVSIPPWKLGLGDLKELSERRSFKRTEHQRDPVGKAPWSNAMKTWAMVYDSCRVSGYRWWVVTTYEYWVFGTWSLDWSGAEVTEPIPFDKTHGMSVVELITFWLECARGKTKYWRMAANDPREN